ncbi:hypothetical protein HTX81_08010 [Pseudomonas lini]|uniref:helix-turn-helix domain-containing protein n=1 Tax=Pseudomonas lini TaxID=163011 RepID=UPI00068FB809|nr:helix-turn-helix domain-containing protein [Pseudomonas lini]NSX08526.1 hypothetical protein [Pseudomonas lini]
MDKKKPITKGKLGNESRTNNARSNTQLARLKAWPKLGPTDVLTTMRELNICRPSARISKLRAIDHPIKTLRITSTDDHGRPRQGVALHFLPQQGAQPMTTNQPHQPPRATLAYPNLASLYLFTLPTGADLPLLICLEAALWIS